jgi:hypothetical protein
MRRLHLVLTLIVVFTALLVARPIHANPDTPLTPTKIVVEVPAHPTHQEILERTHLAVQELQKNSPALTGNISIDQLPRYIVQVKENATLKPLTVPITSTTTVTATNGITSTDTITQPIHLARITTANTNKLFWDQADRNLYCNATAEQLRATITWEVDPINPSYIRAYTWINFTRLENMESDFYLDFEYIEAKVVGAGSAIMTLPVYKALAGYYQTGYFSAMIQADDEQQTITNQAHSLWTCRQVFMPNVQK